MFNTFCFKNKLLNSRFKASTMVYAVFIMVVILAIIGSIIVLAYLNNMVITQANKSEVINSNLNSAINLLLADPDICHMGESRTISLYGDGNDSVQLSKKQWGVYNLYQVKTWWKHLKMKKTFLAGGYVAAKDKLVLYLADQNKPLSVCGNTLISGECYLPKSGIKKTHIDGKSFLGDKLVEGNVFFSEKQLLPLKDELSSMDLQRFIKQYLLGEDAIIYDWDELEVDSLHGSFDSLVKIIFSPGEINLSGKKISGQVIILSEKRVIVDRYCQLEDVLISAPSIILKPGSAGALQCIARDTLIVGDSCYLRYPSALVLTKGNIDRESVTGNPWMWIKNRSIIEGVVLSNTFHDPKRKSPVVLFDKGVKVYGQVYCNSFLQTKASVFGSAYVMSFFLKTPSSIYENHLLDAQFDKTKLSEFYTGVELTSNQNIKNVIKWFH